MSGCNTPNFVIPQQLAFTTNFPFPLLLVSMVIPRDNLGVKEGNLLDKLVVGTRLRPRYGWAKFAVWLRSLSASSYGIKFEQVEVEEYPSSEGNGLVCFKDCCELDYCRLMGGVGNIRVGCAVKSSVESVGGAAS
ncbi:hypothetical protein HAX54_046543 [Datura stramonium]|uniref:Uncharacterized protein n=1 Tax=Datura stramonium TaxID=4076 RepID=A0ABS8SRM3_DATST|nr:hypothetical protein [Datura stramonium]